MSAIDVLKARGVTRLCHFTLLKSLTHIITSEEGILASSSIRQDIKTSIDKERYDGELDYVCCTVQYPNSWFLRKAMGDNPDKVFRDWVVMYVGLSILNYRDTKFCPCNASTKRGAHIDGNMDNLESIFATRVVEWKCPRQPSMLPSCPTNGQAEILIKDNIPREFIIGIAVGNEDLAKRVYAMLEMCCPDPVPLFVAPDVFTPDWSEMIRNGRRPAEIRCDWPKED